MQDTNGVTVRFGHLVLRGSSYEIGKAQGEMIRRAPGAVDYFGSGPIPEYTSIASRALALMRQYCPGLEEEINGFCDAARIPLEKLVFLSLTHMGGTRCSHLAVLPEATSSGHVLVGRNYDFGEKSDDLRLTTVFPEGRYASLGFPTLFFGRNEGMNEHGLSVTFSGEGLPVSYLPGLKPAVQEGLQFWALVRTILDTCQTVSEAEACAQEFPCCGNPILILADAGGHASRMEIFGAHKKITRVDGDPPYISASNHFISPEMRAIDPTCMAHSKIRLDTMDRYLKENRGNISIDGIKQLLSTKYPEGLCTHYYPEYFGTLHSCVFDLNARSAGVAFGSPAVNAWRRVDFKAPQPGEFDVVLPYEHASPGFWAPVE